MEGKKVLLLNTQPEPVTEDQAQRVLRLIDLQPGTVRSAEASARTPGGDPLLRDGEHFNLKGCTFEVKLVEGALAVIKYVGLSSKQKARQLRAGGVKGGKG